LRIKKSTVISRGVEILCGKERMEKLEQWRKTKCNPIYFIYKREMEQYIREIF
jgi:hypothetical protein